MFDWLRAHEAVVGWLGLISGLMFIGSLVAVPWLLVRIPGDFFQRRQHYLDRSLPTHPVLRMVVLVAKNLCGVVLILAGIVMLVLPGQGILTILVGLICVDFPGKFAFERWAIRRRGVIHSINWLRKKAGREPLMSPDEERL